MDEIDASGNIADIV